MAGNSKTPSKSLTPKSPLSSVLPLKKSSSPPAPPSPTISLSRESCTSTRTRSATSSPPKLSTSASSTPAVTLQQEQEGFKVTYLPVKSNGIIDLDQLRSTIRLDTGLVSVMAVNNEIGVIQLMEEIGQICKEFNIGF